MNFAQSRNRYFGTITLSFEKLSFSPITFHLVFRIEKFPCSWTSLWWKATLIGLITERFREESNDLATVGYLFIAKIVVSMCNTVVVKMIRVIPRNARIH